MIVPETKGGRSVRFRLLTVAVFVVWFAGTLAFDRVATVDTTALPVAAQRVVIFGVPGLTLDDVDAATMPRLAALADRGAVAAANVRGGGTTPIITEAYATLGAGYRISSGRAGSGAVDGTGSDTVAVHVIGMPGGYGADAIDRSYREGGRPGALAEALAAGGKRTGVVTNADVIVDGRRSPGAPAATAAALPDGTVAAGTVGPDLTVVSPGSPGGITTSRSAFRDAVGAALDVADLVVVDPGLTTRLDRVTASGGDAATVEAHRAAVVATDGFIGDVAAQLGAEDVLIVVGVTPPGTTWQLSPVVVSGTDVAKGNLVSPSTNRRDLVTLTDVAPTALALLGVPEPEEMSGRVLSVRPGEATLEAMRDFDEMLVSRRSTDQPFTLVFILAQSALYAAGVVMLIRGGLSSRAGSALLYAVLACAAWPLATFWVRGSLMVSSLGMGTGVVTWLLAAGVAAVAMRFRRHALDPLLVVCGATVATIVLDVSTGAHLQYGSFFGYSPNKGTRFVGLGNAAFALLGAATVVVCSSLVARARDRANGWWAAALVALTVVIADGAPWMGADVGGILSLVPVLGLLLWVLAGRTIRWRTVVVAVLGGVMALAVAVGLDALRPVEHRTHLSRFFLGSGDGTAARSILADKWSANMRILRESVWAWFVPIPVALSLVALTIGGLWQRALPARSPQRHGVVATLALALVGWLLNDSGIVVVALTSVYIGPFVLLLARSNEASNEASDELSAEASSTATVSLGEVDA